MNSAQKNDITRLLSEISKTVVLALLPALLLSTSPANASQVLSTQSKINLAAPAKLIALPENTTPISVSPMPRPNPTKPEANPDFESGPMNTPIVLSPAENDKVGSSAFSLASMSLCLTDCDLYTSVSPIALCDTNCGIYGPVSPIIGKSLLQDQGSWTVDQSTGLVTFTPALDWFETSTIRYVMFDLDGNRVESTLTVEIPPMPNFPIAELADTGEVRDPSPLGWAAILAAVALWLRRFGLKSQK